MGEAYPNGGMNVYDNWYAVQVRCGREDEIVRACDMIIDNHALVECFIPRCKRMRKIRGQWHNIEEILFRGYVFMISDHIDDLFNELKKIPDLTKLLGNDGKNIYPIYKDEAMFLARFGGSEHVVDISCGYIEGDSICITNGPLMGQEGSIMKIDRHKRVAYVDVSLFGQITTVQVGLEVISKS